MSYARRHPVLPHARQHVGYRQTSAGTLCLACALARKDPGIRLERGECAPDLRCVICGWRLAGPLPTAHECDETCTSACFRCYQQTGESVCARTCPHADDEEDDDGE